MPTTRRGRGASRAPTRPSCISARSGVVDVRSPSRLPAGRLVRYAPAPAASAAAMKSWPSRSATIGTNSWPGRSDRLSNDTPSSSTSGPMQSAAGRRRRRRMPGIARRRHGTVAHGGESTMTTFGAHPPHRALRRAVRRARRQLHDRRPRARAPPTRRSTGSRRSASRPRASGRSRRAPSMRSTPGRDALPDRLDPSGPSLSPTPMLAEATAGTGSRSCCRCSTGRWARTAPCRGCSS